MHPSLRTELAFLLSTRWPGGGYSGCNPFRLCVGGWEPMPNQIYQCHVHSNSTLQPANSHWDVGFCGKSDSKMGVTGRQAGRKFTSMPPHIRVHVLLRLSCKRCVGGTWCLLHIIRK
jgi:hypothetical protein